MMYDQTRAQQPPDNRPGSTGRHISAPESLLPPDARAKLAKRLHLALNTFADSPRQALEDSDGALDEITTQLVNALAERRRVLRAGWQDQDPEAQSTEYRLALRQYRELTERLLRL